MSMISAQIDELRMLASTLDTRYRYADDIATALRKAADTVWELRGSVHRERAEADRLREELADAPKCETCEAMLDCDECLRADVSHKEFRRLNAENARLRSELESVGTAAYLYGRGGINDENAKLRELAQDIYSEYRYLRVRFHRTYVQHEERMRAIEQRMRELGVEVES